MASVKQQLLDLKKRVTSRPPVTVLSAGETLGRIRDGLVRIMYGLDRQYDGAFMDAGRIRPGAIAELASRGDRLAEITLKITGYIKTTADTTTDTIARGVANELLRGIALPAETENEPCLKPHATH